MRWLCTVTTFAISINHSSRAPQRHRRLSHRLVPHVRRDKIVDDPMRHRSSQRPQPVHVMVLHLILRDHQAHAPCWIKSYQNVNIQRPFSTLIFTLLALTDTSVPRLRRRRRQRREAESYTDKYRAQCWTECFALARIETNAKGEEDQAQTKHVFQHEQLSRRDLCCVDCAAWNGALLWLQQNVFGSNGELRALPPCSLFTYDRKVFLPQPQLQPIPTHNCTQSLRDNIQHTPRKRTEPSKERSHRNARVNVSSRRRRRRENEQRQSYGVQQRGVQADSHG